MPGGVVFCKKFAQFTGLNGGLKDAIIAPIY